jgi:hypothetical protein
VTSTNTDAINQSVAAFKILPVDDQLAALAMIYTEVAGSITSATLKITTPEVARKFLNQIEHMSQEEQLLALRDLLTGAGSSPITLEYQSLDTNSKLAMWYQLAQGMGSTIAAIPSDYTVSSEEADFLGSLKSMDFEHLISFLSSVV